MASPSTAPGIGGNAAVMQSPTSKPAGPRRLRDGVAVDPKTQLWPRLEFETGRDLAHLRASFLSYKSDVSGTDAESMRLVMTEIEIHKVVGHLASRINELYRGATRDQPVVMCGILNGVCFFFSDLMKRLDIPYDVTFAKFGSYGDGMQQGAGSAVTILDGKKFAKGTKVLLLDELEDNGKTMNTVRLHVIEKLGIPEDDVTTCVIFSKSQQGSAVTKKGMRKSDMIGVYIPDVWLVGYGLDTGGTRRGWVHLFGAPKSAGVPPSQDDAMFAGDAAGAGDADVAYDNARRGIVRQLQAMKLRTGDPHHSPLRLDEGAAPRKRARAASPPGGGPPPLTGMLTPPR